MKLHKDKDKVGQVITMSLFSFVIDNVDRDVRLSMHDIIWNGIYRKLIININRPIVDNLKFKRNENA